MPVKIVQENSKKTKKFKKTLKSQHCLRTPRVEILQHVRKKWCYAELCTATLIDLW